jgi:ketosteroid isomerase-like protein
VTQEEAVRRANAAFYAAFRALDVARMEDVWLREPYITCVHPGGPVLTGWGPIMASWERIFEHTFEVSISTADTRVHIGSDTAWIVLIEQIQSRSYEGITTGAVLATNVFELCGTHWYIVHHHGSALDHVVDENTGSLQ